MVLYGFAPTAWFNPWLSIVPVKVHDRLRGFYLRSQTSWVLPSDMFSLIQVVCVQMMSSNQVRTGFCHRWNNRPVFTAELRWGNCSPFSFLSRIQLSFGFGSDQCVVLRRRPGRIVVAAFTSTCDTKIEIPRCIILKQQSWHRCTIFNTKYIQLQS